MFITDAGEVYSWGMNSQVFELSIFSILLLFYYYYFMLYYYYYYHFIIADFFIAGTARAEQ